MQVMVRNLTSSSFPGDRWGSQFAECHFPIVSRGPMGKSMCGVSFPLVFWETVWNSHTHMPTQTHTCPHIPHLSADSLTLALALALALVLAMALAMALAPALAHVLALTRALAMAIAMAMALIN